MSLQALFPPDDGSEEFLPRLLAAIRRYLDMDVAFVAEFSGDQRVFRHVDAASGEELVRTGHGGPLADSYCLRISDGRFPAVMQDARTLPDAAALPFPIAAHVGVPLHLPDGSLYGTVCCFSQRPDATLGEREVSLVRVLAELAGAHLYRARLATGESREAAVRIRQVLDTGSIVPVYQPIVDLRSGRPVGFEALARFPAEPRQGPDRWFAEAEKAGLGVELELAAIAAALPALAQLPENVYLSVNLSPRVPAARLLEMLAGVPARRVVLEITEHEVVEEYGALQALLLPLRELGVRIAVDDAGAGYASFRHILGLRPDFIKLDLSLTRDIDTDLPRRALATALVRFGAETGSEIVAEGVETAAELDTLRALGVRRAQGYHLGRPLPIAQAWPAAAMSAAA